MKSLSQSTIFNLMNKYSSVKISSLNEENFIVNPAEHSELQMALSSISKRFKDAMRLDVINAYNKHDIELLWGLPDLAKIPKSLCMWAKKKNGKTIVYINITHLVTKNQKINEFNISATTLYVLLQSAYVYRQMIEKPNTFASNSRFAEASTKCFSSMFTALYDRSFGLRSNENMLNTIKYAAARFYLSSCLEVVDNDRAMNIAKSVFQTPVLPSVIQGINEHFGNFTNLDLTKFVTLIQTVSPVFSGERAKYTENIMADTQNQYGAMFLLSLEIPAYLIMNIIMIMHGSMMNNQKRLEGIFMKDASAVYTAMTLMNLG